MDDVILLADPKSNSWKFAKEVEDYIQQKERKIKIHLEEVSVEPFNNEEIDMHVLKNMRRKDIYFIHDATKNPQNWWVELLMLKDLLLSASAESVTLVLPNMLYSRKDRKERPHVPISARALANSISPGSKRIITMDLHSDQIQGFYPPTCPFDNLHSYPEVTRYLTTHNLPNLENLTIVSPDGGGVNRARAFAQKLKVKNPIAFIYKKRDKPGNIEEMLLVGDVKNSDILIVDDIIDSGGTLIKAAELLREHGAKELYCYGTHGFFTKGTKELCNIFSRVMTSNTHYKEGALNGVEIVDVAPVFAEAIYRAQKGISISELFE